MIDIVLVALYLALLLALGLLFGTKTSSFESYAVAGRSYGAFFIFATFSASYIGGGASIGNAEKVYLFGIAYVVTL